MGYREQRLEQERFRVSFRANADLKGPQVEDMALRRAAELTTQNGYEWFHGRHPQHRPRRRKLHAERPHGRPRRLHRLLRLGGLGIGLGFNIGGDSRQYQSTLEILMGQGAKPSDPNAYDARSVLSRPM